MAFKMPEALVEMEPMTRERAVVGETYGLTFTKETVVHACLVLFVDGENQVIAAVMDVRGAVAPIGTKWVETYKWQRS